MERNNHPDFVGLEKIKAKQKWQLDLLEAWAGTDQWSEIHSAHYDWWMFPVDQPSSFGFAWTVYAGDVQELKTDERYLKDYLRGVDLLSTSWGWDLAAQSHIIDPHPDQRWQNWPVRLHKCARSLQLFGFAGEFQSLKAYANGLMKRGENMSFRGHDLSGLFR